MELFPSGKRDGCDEHPDQRSLLTGTDFAAAESGGKGWMKAFAVSEQTLIRRVLAEWPEV
jgi:hypothetical protein